MKEATIYTAIDGAEFRSKDECLNHENQLIFEKSSIRLWNKYGEPITEFSADVCRCIKSVIIASVNISFKQIQHFFCKHHNDHKY